MNKEWFSRTERDSNGSEKVRVSVKIVQKNTEKAKKEKIPHPITKYPVKAVVARYYRSSESPGWPISHRWIRRRTNDRRSADKWRRTLVRRCSSVDRWGRASENVAATEISLSGSPARRLCFHWRWTKVSVCVFFLLIPHLWKAKLTCCCFCGTKKRMHRATQIKIKEKQIVYDVGLVAAVNSKSFMTTTQRMRRLFD